MDLTAVSVIKKLNKLANPTIAAHSQRFFKTGPGEYGEDDIFLGIRVPVIRQQVKQFRGLTLSESLVLIRSELHEVRLFAVLMMVDLYERANDKDKKIIFNHYLKQTEWVNNWDLVDSSAHKIVGDYLLDKSRDALFHLAKSNQLWERRIAMVACYRLIKNDDFDDVLKIAELLIDDKHDLIHKAVGWMLRELGNRDTDRLNHFLEKHYLNMPRTMLRYAIEKLPQEQRLAYLHSKI